MIDDERLNELLERLVAKGNPHSKFSASEFHELYDGVIVRLEAYQKECPNDTTRMNWLEMQDVEVRTPLVYGSRKNFEAYLDIQEGGDDPSNIRQAIDSAITQQAKGQSE